MSKTTDDMTPLEKLTRINKLCNEAYSLWDSLREWSESHTPYGSPNAFGAMEALEEVNNYVYYEMRYARKEEEHGKAE